MTITAVGTETDSESAGLATLTYTTQNVGNLLWLSVNIADNVVTVSSIAGTAANNWANVLRWSDADGHNFEVWYGIVISVGSKTINLTYSGAESNMVELIAMEFHSSLGSPAWTVDKSNHVDGSTTGSTGLAWPSLVCTNAGELYVGYGHCEASFVSGATSGYTYNTTANGNAAIFNVNCSGTQAPTGDPGGSNWEADGVLFSETALAGATLHNVYVLPSQATQGSRSW